MHQSRSRTKILCEVK
uniref:Uncharacterized protein n=1 Tax=Arundo donax TaxID=35708 RepID=A0A0A9FTP1_ARUDO